MSGRNEMIIYHQVVVRFNQCMDVPNAVSYCQPAKFFN